MPTTFVTARLMGFNRDDAMAGATGATVGFGAGTWKDSGTGGGGAGTKMGGGRYNSAGTWVSE